jgi:RNA recognition motif-containing protein
MTIKIFNLSLNVTDTDVQKMFTRYGIVDAVTVDRNKFDGRSKGNAVVDMPVEKEAKMAILSLDQTLVDGKKISVAELVEIP